MCQLTRKKELDHLVNFAVPTDHREKVEEGEELNKYLDLARELK